MNRDSNTTVMVATHKNYEMPADIGYVPIHVGKAVNNAELGFDGDDSGDNISVLNPYFCELTGLYWIWKNTNTTYYGLAHYRRYFKPISGSNYVVVNGKKIASTASLTKMLDKFDIVLAKPRNYWIETVESHYKNAHYGEDLIALKQVVSEMYPKYVSTMEKVFKGRSISLFNMFVMRSDLFSQYAEWLFSILFELQGRVKYAEYGPYQRRIFGFLAERLMNVWVEHTIPKNRIFYQGVVNLEGENLAVKAKGLIARKFMGSKLD